MNRAERRRAAREKEKGGMSHLEAVYQGFDDGSYVKNPLEIIEAAAEGMNIPLKKPNPNCKKCHGRGWIAVKSGTGEPIPCTCIFVKENFDRELGEDKIEKKDTRNRKQKRTKKEK